MSRVFIVASAWGDSVDGISELSLISLARASRVIDVIQVRQMNTPMEPALFSIMIDRPVHFNTVKIDGEPSEKLTVL